MKEKKAYNKTLQIHQKIFEIEGYSNYFCDELGNVYSKSLKGKRLGAPNSDGYLRSNVISDKGIKRRVFNHRLISCAFDLEGEGDTINHKDGNKLNNSPGNLEWSTRSYQMYHAYSLGLKKVQPYRDSCGRFTYA
jgi:hypothetical protein